MEINFYHSPLIMPALVICVAVSILLFRENKSIGSFLILLGFIIVTVTKFPINYCMGVVALTSAINEYPYLCNSFTPHIQGLGFISIAYGLAKFLLEIKKAHEKVKR